MSNLVQIENANTQQQMLDHVSLDDGMGTTIVVENGTIQNMEAYKSDNFRKHGGNLENGKVVNPRSGGLNIPGVSSAGKATMDSRVDYHNHPSGQVKNINSNGSFTLHGTIGFTTSDDVSWAEGKIKYQFDMKGKTVNIYNSTGVIAIIPFKNFGE